MAIVKFNNSRNSRGSRRDKLKRSIEYIVDKKKTYPYLIGGLGVDEENALERMQTVKNYYGKEGGREHIHFCVSFEGECDTEAVYYIAETIASFYSGYQILYAVHLNTNNTHIHFVLNTVCVENGYKFTQSPSELQKFKEYVQNIVERSGIEMKETYIYEDYYDDYDYEEENYNVRRNNILRDIMESEEIKETIIKLNCDIMENGPYINYTQIIKKMIEDILDKAIDIMNNYV